MQIFGVTISDCNVKNRSKREQAEYSALATLEKIPPCFHVADFLNYAPRTTAWRQLKRLERMGLIVKIRHGLYEKKDLT